MKYIKDFLKTISILIFILTFAYVLYIVLSNALLGVLLGFEAGYGIFLIISWIIVLAIESNLKGSVSKYILPIFLALCMVCSLIFANQLDFKPSGFSASTSAEEQFYFIITLIIIPNLALCFLISLIFLERFTIVYLKKEKINRYNNVISVTNGDVYCIKVKPFREVVGYLTFNEMNNNEYKLSIIMDDTYENERKEAKTKVIVKKLMKLGYKKIIVDKENYDYLKESLNYYNIKSIEDEDSYVLEI